MSESINSSFILYHAHLLDTGNYVTAISAAIDAMRMAEGNENEVLKRLAIESLEHSIDLYNAEKRNNGTPLGQVSRKCYFCGKTEPKVALFAGAEAMICNECVNSTVESGLLKKN